MYYGILLSYKIAYYKSHVTYSGGGFAGDDPKVFEAKIQVHVNFKWVLSLGEAKIQGERERERRERENEREREKRE